MRKLTRLGTILVVLSVSFAVITLVGGSHTAGGAQGAGLNPGQSSSGGGFWLPRTARIEVNSQSPIDFNLTDPSGTRLLTVKSVKTGTFNAELNYRGWYRIKFRNVGNTTTLAMFDITFYNFEKDQITISLTLGIAGIALITAQQILYRRKPKPTN